MDKGLYSGKIVPIHQMKYFFEINSPFDVGLDYFLVCKISDHLLTLFFQNDSNCQIDAKLKRVAMLLTKTELTIAHTYDFLFIYLFISLLSSAYISFCI
jgi:hypothetical protein